MITTGSIYPLHEYLLLTVLNRGRRLLPGDQLHYTLKSCLYRLPAFRFYPGNSEQGINLTGFHSSMPNNKIFMLHILFPHLFFFILVYNSNLQQTAERLNLRAKMQSTKSQKKKNYYLSHHWQTAKVDLDSLFFLTDLHLCPINEWLTHYLRHIRQRFYRLAQVCKPHLCL